MSERAPPIYRRGKYWVDKLCRSDGTERSPHWYVFWYDVDARREASASTGTPDDDEAIRACDRRYLADRGESHAFCYACGQPLASAADYLLLDAIADYRIEHGDLQISAGPISARLKHVIDFVDAEEAAGGVFGINTSCATACGTPFITAFRAWSRLQPVVSRNKKQEITASRPRSVAATEESVLQLAAALNHAADADPPRSERRPIYKPLPRSQVSRPRLRRADVATLARMLAFAAEPDKKRASLHAFLVASICTAARPDTVLDISIAPERCQWEPGLKVIDLNPHGRAQTKKYRPIIPVLPALEDWLRAEWRAYQKLDRADRIGAGFLVNYYGRPVTSVRTAWRTMIDELDLPKSREWGAYILRHTLATLLRAKGADKWELQNFLGHARTTTDIYAVSIYPSVTQALTAILDEIEQLSPGAIRRNGAENALPGPSTVEVKMTG